MKPFYIFVSILALLASSPVKSQVLYVSPLGNDKNPGTKAKPIASFAKAQQLVRALDTRSKVKVIFAKGTYYLPETIRFTEMDNKASVVYTSEKEGDAVISGGSLLKLKWTFYERGIYKASVPPNTVIDQLYINGVRQRMARFPNAISGKNVLMHGILIMKQNRIPCLMPFLQNILLNGKIHREGIFMACMLISGEICTG
ncbi:MAG: hypothetical protein IPP79_21950 [Chitinophagaceae bacterium]|nr:hypothetical protein [Chitinophagaceae bacterium]